MSNQHMITAANNLERAMSDLQLYKNELKQNLENLKRDVTKRTGEIDTQISALTAMIADSDQGQSNRGQAGQIQNLQHEKDQLHQQVTNEERQVNDQVRAADQNAADISAFAQRLRMIA
jgi:hypothetical protein